MKLADIKPVERIRKENIKHLRTCFKLGNGAKVQKVSKYGYNLTNTTSAQIIDGLNKLEEEFNKGELVKKVTIKGNEKLGDIPAISFPNIFEQSTFMLMVKNNPELEEKYAVVKILMDYFREYRVCLNCGSCSGLCYNNKFIYTKPGKAISDLRTLLAYIVDPIGLAEEIKKRTKFTTVFRINANGEVHSEEMLNWWMHIVKKQPNTRFFTYTKSYELFENYLQENKKFPKNFIMNMSIMEGQEEGLKKFEKLYEGNKYVATTKIPLDAKYICNFDCPNCELCYTKLNKKNNTIYVRIH